MKNVQRITGGLAQAMYKYELARAAGVSSSTLRCWLCECSEKLKDLGYSKRQKLPNPAIVKFLVVS